MAQDRDITPEADPRAYAEMLAWLKAVEAEFSLPKSPDDFSGIGQLPSSQPDVPKAQAHLRWKSRK